MVATTIALPNVRKIFIPDPGYILFEGDLKGAESQVVAAESGDPALRAIFASGQDVHTENAIFTFGPKTGHKYTDWYRRDRLKRCVYAIQNGGGADKCSELLKDKALGYKFYNHWTGRFPAIKEWHRKVELDVKIRKVLENVWGYKTHWFDRTEGNILGEAIPWITQSTIGITINHAYVNLDDLGIEVLLQVHDALIGQFPESKFDEMMPLIHSAMTIAIPYPDPLIIPVDLGFSSKSWGELEKWSPPGGAQIG